MRQLIQIHEQDGQKLVNARELHEFLESKQQYSDWIKNRIEKYEFIKGQDYVSFSENYEKPHGGRPTKQHGLTIDMAKELCMVENNDKGRQARRYFIEVEKQYTTSQLKAPSRKELAQWVIDLENENEKAKKKIHSLEQKTELMDRVLDADEKIDIGQAAKILDLPFGRNTLFQKLRDKGVFFKNRNEPKQQYVKQGYFVLKEKYIERNAHHGFVVVKVLVTQRGLEFINNLFAPEQKQKKLALMR